MEWELCHLGQVPPCELRSHRVTAERQLSTGPTFPTLAAYLSTRGAFKTYRCLAPSLVILILFGWGGDLGTKSLWCTPGVRTTQMGEGALTPESD